MTAQQKQLVKSWVVNVICLILGLLSLESHSDSYLFTAIPFLGLSRLFRKDVDADDFRPFQEMRRGEKLFALLWYYAFAILVIVLVLKKPKLIDYDFRQSLLLFGIIFVPLLPVALRREVGLFMEGGKNDT